MRRAARLLAWALIAQAVGLGVLGVVLVLGTDSTLARAVYGANVVVILAVMLGLSYVVWPRSAR